MAKTHNQKEGLNLELKRTESKKTLNNFQMPEQNLVLHP